MPTSYTSVMLIKCKALLLMDVSEFLIEREENLGYDKNIVITCPVPHEPCSCCVSMCSCCVHNTM